MPGLLKITMKHSLQDRRATTLAVCVSAMFLICPAFADVVRFDGTTMGTYYSIAIDAPATINTDELKAKVDERLADVNRQMSTWQADSEISQFNTQETLDWFPVSADFARVVAEAKRIHELSDGAFDPTVSPIIALWGFGDSRARVIPEQSVIDAARSLTGMQFLECRQNPPALRKLKPQLQVNLSAIAKGFGVDVIAELLQSLGHNSFVVDIGGEDRAGNRKSNGALWRLGVESPTGGIQKVVQLENCSIATSGDYRNFFVAGERKFSHVMNPVTGWPVENPPASVSVIHESCMTADAWATALMVLGAEQGILLAKSQKLEVMFLDLSPEDRVMVSATGRFADENGTTIESAAESAVNLRESVLEQTTSAERDLSQPVWWFPIAAALGIFGLAMVGMAVGVLFRNKALKGSCGGIAAFQGNGGESICELCTKPKEDCLNPELRERMKASAANESNKKTVDE